MTRLCYAILLLLLLTSPLAAQDDTATPFPVLDEATIFADGVTVIERLPVLNFDNETRQLFYYNPNKGEWSSHNYPEGLDFIATVSREPLPDGTYFLFLSALLLPNEAKPENTWLFSPTEGIIYHPDVSETVCGVFPIYDIPFANSETWIIDEANQRLCNIANGAISPLLPENATKTAIVPRDFLGYVLTTTSNQNFVYIDGGYVYDIGQNIFRYIGIPAFQEQYSVELVENILILWNPLRLFIGDMQRENSLFMVAEGRIEKKTFAYDGENRFVYGYLRNQETVINELDLTTGAIRQVISEYCTEARVYLYRCAPEGIWLHPTNPNLLLYRYYQGTLIGIDLRNQTNFLQGSEFVTWLGHNRVLVQQSDGFIYDYVIAEDSRGTYTTGIEWLTASISIYPSIISPNKHYMFASSFTEEHSMIVVDLRTREQLEEEILLAHSDDTHFWWTWQEDNTIIAELRREYDVVGRWHIRIDALDEEQS